MNEITNYQAIDESRLEQSNYFQSLFQECCGKGLLTDSQIERIQLELIELMGKEIERFTNDESSSVPVEKAQEILQSITYSMGYFLKNTTDMTQRIDILKEMKIRELFYKGMEQVQDGKKRAAALLKELQNNFLQVDSYAYHDTILTGLPDFFHNYSIEFGAHEIPASFDYPSFETITDLSGVEYIERFLKYLTIENRFLVCFPVDEINQLIKGFDREAEHMLINLFELVLTNAIGCELLGQKITELNVGAEEQKWLQHNLEKLDKAELEHKLNAALIEINRELSPGTEFFDYAAGIVSPLAARVLLNLQNNSLGKVFLSFHCEPVKEVYYEDGILMTDEELRDFIERLKEYSLTGDKINLIKEKVRSMADFVELLEECFYEEEYDEVLRSLSENERAILRQVILMDIGSEHYEEFEPEKLWQKKLFQNWQ